MRGVRGLLLSMLVVSCAWGHSAAGQSSQGPDRALPREQLFPTSVVPTTVLPSAPYYQPLTPKQKFQHFYKNAKSPYVFFGGLVTSVSWQLRDRPPFGTGNLAFAEGFGAAVTQREASLLLSRYLIPTALHQDPRYFPAAEGSSDFHRAAYAASRVLFTRADSGRQTWNASYILGNLGSAGLANLYISNRDAGTIFSDFAVGMGTDAGYNIIREFWPRVRKHVPGKRIRQLGDLVIGVRNSRAAQGGSDEPTQKTQNDDEDRKDPKP